MSIHFQVLGEPGRDNAVFLTVDSGQSITRFLFDCGHGTTDNLSTSELMSLDGLFISHYHMDHVSAFDSVLRFNFNREDNPFLIVGPNDTCRAVWHRLRGFTWNLVADAKGAVEIRELNNGALRRVVYPTRFGFEESSLDETNDSDGTVFQSKSLSVKMIELDHGCVSAGYVVRESYRENIDIEKMKELGLSPGPWLQAIKNPSTPPEQSITVGDSEFTADQLRNQLVTQTKGESFAYLTDFRTVGEDFGNLVEFIKGVDTVICENNYQNADAELAAKHHHLTSSEVGKIAAAAGVGKLILFHLSDRYLAEDWKKNIEEVRTVFAESHWPRGWTI